jgi:hypothetical protein
MNARSCEYYKIITDRHDAYMRLIMASLKKARKDEGIDSALCIIHMHQEAGDDMLTDTDFDVLKKYVTDDQYHIENKLTSNN